MMFRDQLMLIVCGVAFFYILPICKCPLFGIILIFVLIPISIHEKTIWIQFLVHFMWFENVLCGHRINQKVWNSKKSKKKFVEHEHEQSEFTKWKKKYYANPQMLLFHIFFLIKIVQSCYYFSNCISVELVLIVCVCVCVLAHAFLFSIQLWQLLNSDYCTR